MPEPRGEKFPIPQINRCIVYAHISISKSIVLVTEDAVNLWMFLNPIKSTDQPIVNSLFLFRPAFKGGIEVIIVKK